MAWRGAGGEVEESGALVTLTTPPLLGPDPPPCCSSIASMDLRPPSSSRISWKGLLGVRGRGEEGGGSMDKEERKEAEEGREAREVCRAREEERPKGCWMGNVC